MIKLPITNEKLVKIQGAITKVCNVLMKLAPVCKSCKSEVKLFFSTIAKLTRVVEIQD
jgi:DNA replicative helicase MCM subunit Mcm2 (Cdc46/Mcm family)